MARVCAETIERDVHFIELRHGFGRVSGGKCAKSIHVKRKFMNKRHCIRRIFAESTCAALQSIGSKGRQLHVNFNLIREFASTDRAGDCMRFIVQEVQ